jgi:SAM-dependent methyltransferase
MDATGGAEARRLRVLSLGCGRAKDVFPEAGRACDVVGVDVNPNVGADVIHDLDQFPYPFPDDSFDLVICQDVLEHLQNIPRAMAEIHRVLRPGGRLRIRTPHFSSCYAYNDPTHQRFFGYYAFDRFLPASEGNPDGAGQFLYQSRQIVFPKPWRLLGLACLANRFPRRWEQFFSFIVRAENLLIEMEAVK